MDTIKNIYYVNPEYVKDTLHIHFFKTKIYFDERMNDPSRLKISRDLFIALFLVDNAIGYTIISGKYKFKIKSDYLGMPTKTPFPLLLNSLIRVCYSSTDLDDMYNKFYESNDPLLINLAEQFKVLNINLSSELFDFIKRKECNTEIDWKLNDIIKGSWNYTLLALNNKVWESAFDKKYLSELFETEKKILDTIDVGKLSMDKYQKYIIQVDKLITEKIC